MEFQFDEIGYWSQVKLAILGDYYEPYARIVSKKKFSHVYIDGFSGAGVAHSKSTGEEIEGSPLRALAINPPFDEYFLIDLDRGKTEYLRQRIGDRADVQIFNGDCNEVLLDEVFPRVRYEDYRRGLCLLDPYGLHLDWQVIAKAGELKTIDLFLNFPIMDMNRNVLWRDADRVSPGHERMTRFWGDESWITASYRESEQLSLFGDPELQKQDNEVVAEAFRQRLMKVAGFKCVPTPLPMRNSRNAVVYYLFFASQQPVAEKIVKAIFKKYRDYRPSADGD